MNQLMMQTEEYIPKTYRQMNYKKFKELVIGIISSLKNKEHEDINVSEDCSLGITKLGEEYILEIKQGNEEIFRDEDNAKNINISLLNAFAEIKESIFSGGK